ncbi:DUF917 family protein [bacterium]|nr:DUF917 family protein [bacterium]
MRELKKTEMSDISVGAGLLGAGGGGAVSEGLKMVDRVLKFGDSVALADIDEIDDESWGAVIAGMGSPVASRLRPRTWSLTWAMQLLGETLGFDPAFVIPFELGPATASHRCWLACRWASPSSMATRSVGPCPRST